MYYYSILLIFIIMSINTYGKTCKVIPIIDADNTKTKLLIWETTDEGQFPSCIIWYSSPEDSIPSRKTKLVYPELDSFKVATIILDINNDNMKDIIFDVRGVDKDTYSKQEYKYVLDMSDSLRYKDSLTIGFSDSENMFSGNDKYIVENTEISKTEDITISKLIIEKQSSELNMKLTSAENILSSYSIDVYPNPASEFINIQINTLNTDSKLEILLVDMAGKTLERIYPNNNHPSINSFDIREFPCGVYYIVSKLNGKIVKTNKAIKQ